MRATPAATADAMNPQRHIDKLHVPTVVTYGSLDTPDFQRPTAVQRSR
jgi:hypothetical protein